VEVNQQPLALFRRLYLPRNHDEALRDLIVVPLGAPCDDSASFQLAQCSLDRDVERRDLTGVNDMRRR
jgi:hypothetical protein